MSDDEVREVLESVSQARWAELEEQMEDVQSGDPSDENFLEQNIIFGGCCLRRLDALAICILLGNESLATDVLAERNHWLVDPDNRGKSFLAIAEVIDQRVLAREDLRRSHAHDGFYNPRDH